MYDKGVNVPDSLLGDACLIKGVNVPECCREMHVQSLNSTTFCKSVLFLHTLGVVLLDTITNRTMFPCSSRGTMIVQNWLTYPRTYLLSSEHYPIVIETYLVLHSGVNNSRYR